MSYSAQCLFCAHFQMAESACAAFPDGIPSEVFTGMHDHRRPYPGDNGVGFKSMDTDTQKPKTR